MNIKKDIREMPERTFKQFRREMTKSPEYIHMFTHEISNTTESQKAAIIAICQKYRLSVNTDLEILEMSTALNERAFAPS
jgi:hypothetical protein